MSQIKKLAPRSHNLVVGSLMLICLFTVGGDSAVSQDRSKPETIEATATGTDTQLGKNFNITLIIYEYSPQADKQILTEAFQSGKDQGLYNALSKMKSGGHIAVAATPRYA